MSSSCSHPYPVKERSLSIRKSTNEPPQPREAEHLALGVVGLDQAVAVEEGAIASLQHSLLLLIGHPRHQPKRHPPRPQLVGLAITSPAREVVSGVGVAEASAL